MRLSSVHRHTDPRIGVRIATVVRIVWTVLIDAAVIRDFAMAVPCAVLVPIQTLRVVLAVATTAVVVSTDLRVANVPIATTTIRRAIAAIHVERRSRDCTTGGSVNHGYGIVTSPVQQTGRTVAPEGWFFSSISGSMPRASGLSLPLDIANPTSRIAMSEPSPARTLRR
jgi:hypothetical protein